MSHGRYHHRQPIPDVALFCSLVSTVYIFPTSLCTSNGDNVLQLTQEGDKLLVATATKGLCLVPSNDLDLSRAEMFGERWEVKTIGVNDDQFDPQDCQ